MLAPRSEIFEYLREKIGRRALEYRNRLVQKRTEKIVLFSYGNAWPLLTFLKAGGRWEHVFATSASPTVGPKKLAMSPSSTLHGGQYDTKYVTLE